MTTFDNETDALDAAATANRGYAGNDPIVVVDGPGDGEWTTMRLSDAIDSDLLYRWAAL